MSFYNFKCKNPNWCGQMEQLSTGACFVSALAYSTITVLYIRARLPGRITVPVYIMMLIKTIDAVAFHS